MLRFTLDTQHEYADSIKVDILADESVPGNGMQTVVAATFYMTQAQFNDFVEQGQEWFAQDTEAQL